MQFSWPSDSPCLQPCCFVNFPFYPCGTQMSPADGLMSHKEKTRGREVWPGSLVRQGQRPQGASKQSSHPTTVKPAETLLEGQGGAHSGDGAIPMERANRSLRIHAAHA